MNKNTIKSEMTPEAKEKRVAIVNEIFKEIASRGRKFFHAKGETRHSNTGVDVAYLFIKNNKIWYKCEWVSKHRPITEICFSIPKYISPKGWFHGGTLLSLVNDFTEFIKGNDDANHSNGYGGLYCPHWGYSDEDMKAIQAKAVELGYLKLSEKGCSSE